MDQSEQYVLHTYNRFPLVIDHGDGVYVYDTDGKEYLDFSAGIAVLAANAVLKAGGYVIIFSILLFLLKVLKKEDVFWLKGLIKGINTH